MKLSGMPKVPYSMLEYQLFNLLPKNGRKVGAKDLAAARREQGKWKVDNAENVVTVTMNKLIRKVKLNREDFIVEKDPRRRGHLEVEYWISKRNGK